MDHRTNDSSMKPKVKDAAHSVSAEHDDHVDQAQDEDVDNEEKGPTKSPPVAAAAASAAPKDSSREI